MCFNLGDADRANRSLVFDLTLREEEELHNNTSYILIFYIKLVELAYSLRELFYNSLSQDKYYVSTTAQYFFCYISLNS